MPRRFPIFQFPNPPLIVAGLAGVAGRLLSRSSARDRRRLTPLASLVSHLSLLIWAVEEIVAGANWFRRLLGIGGGSYALSRLLPPAGSRDGRASAP
jgi:hypothetical protein